jgi:hypothetical protein
MARNPQQPRRERAPEKEYHVYDPRMTEASGKAVMGGKVRLTEAEAKYYLDQGVIGEQPRKEMSATAKHATGQITGRGPVTLSEEKQQADAKTAAEAEGTSTRRRR